MLFTLSIPAGTLVSSERTNRLVSLIGDVIAFDAKRNADGSFTYGERGNRYQVSAGCCKFTQQDESAEFYPHEDALIAFVA